MNIPTYNGPSLAQLFDWAAHLGFGKFGRQNEHPLQVWEPSKRKNVDEILQILTKNPPLSNPTFRMAINIDPVQYQLFAAQYSKSAFSGIISNDNLSDSKVVHASVKPRSFVASTDSGCLLLVSNASQIVEFCDNNTWSFGEMRRGTEVVLFSKAITSFSCDSSSCLASDQHGSGQMFDIASLRLMKSIRPIQPAGIQASASALLDNGSLIWAMSTLNCSLSIAIDRQSPQCAIQSLNKTIHSLAVVAKVQQVSQQQLTAFVVFETDSAVLRAVVISFHRDQQQMRWILSAVKGGSGILTVGRRPSLSLRADNVLLINGDGFCANVEKRNKDATRKLCDNVPRSIAGVAQYAYGSFDAFVQRAATSTSLSVCDDSIALGAYGQSSALPSGTLAPVSTQFAPPLHFPCGFGASSCVNKNLRIATVGGGGASVDECGSDGFGFVSNVTLNVWFAPPMST